MLANLRCGGLGRQREVFCAPTRDELGAGAGGQQRVHGVGRDEGEDRTAGTPEGLQDLLQDLIGPIGGPEVFCPQSVPQIAGEGGAKFRELPIRVAIELPGGPRHTLRDGLHHRLRHGMGVLVRVECHRNIELGGPVRGHTPQIFTQGQGF